MLISIIVPVYNAAPYLDQCIQSILAQTYTDFELLLINDGSTDQSGAICDQYALQDARIQVFHQQNAGVSAARNLGLDHAKGEWITFVDSDDWISDNYFKVADLNLDSRIDCIFVNIIKKHPEKIINITNFRDDEIDIDTFFENYSLHPHFFGPTGKFFKNEILNKYKLRFDESLSYGEDNLFNCNYFIFTRFIKFQADINYIISPINGLSTAVANLNNDEPKYFKIYSVLKYELKLDNDLIDRNIISSLSRYINAIIYSKLSTSFKIEKLKILINRHSKVIFRLYESNPLISFLIKRNLFLFIKVLEFRNKILN